MRESVRLSQAKLAKEFDVSQSALARYEIDDSTPSPEVFLKYADYFDVSLDYIFGRTDDPHGMIYNNCVKLGLNNPEMARFVEMCFDPDDGYERTIEGNACADALGGGRKMKAVIYARYSSDSQREESIEGQLRECTEYAERNGITILRSYIDRALSARTADRPEFQNMIKDSEQKLFDVVLIWKLDRFSRDRYDSAHYKRILKKNGVKVVSVKENISDGPGGYHP